MSEARPSPAAVEGTGGADRDEARECICGHPRIAHEDDTGFCWDCDACAADPACRTFVRNDLEDGPTDDQEWERAHVEGWTALLERAERCLAGDPDAGSSYVVAQAIRASIGAGTRKDDASRIRPTDGPPRIDSPVDRDAAPMRLERSGKVTTYKPFPEGPPENWPTEYVAFDDYAEAESRLAEVARERDEALDVLLAIWKADQGDGRIAPAMIDAIDTLLRRHGRIT